MAVKWFDSFIRITAAVVLSLAFISSIFINVFLNAKFTTGVQLALNIIAAALILSALAIIYRKRRGIINILLRLLEIKNLVLYFILFGFIIRLLWILLVPSQPVSDFAAMYSAAKEVHGGNFSSFHGYNYFARFAHDTITVLYFSLFYNINGNPAFWIRLANVVFSTASIWLIYLTVKQIFGRKSAAVAAVLLSLFPPFIMYNSQMLSENMAVPFYLASVYFFIRFVKNSKNYGFVFLCGLALSAANMFRMVGNVFLAAYIVFFIIYKIKTSVKAVPLLVIAFIIPLYISSNVLISCGMTETQLWKSKEPFWTSVLKGTNVESRGYWNEEDARVPDRFNYDTEKVKEESIRIIKQRLLHTPVIKLAYLYVSKLESELAVSDFFAYELTVTVSPDTAFVMLLKYFQLAVSVLCNIFYMFILYWSIFYLRKVRNLPQEINFFLILTGGFILLYLISEIQPRYMFIICWVFVIFAIGGLKKKIYDTIYKI